jgi:hypothetical protein
MWYPCCCVRLSSCIMVTNCFAPGLWRFSASEIEDASHGGRTCGACDRAASIRRSVRSSNGPEIRFGAEVRAWGNPQKHALTGGFALSPWFGFLHCFSVDRVPGAS